MIKRYLARILAGLLTVGAVACPADAVSICDGAEGICITGISGAEGILRLDERVLRPGDVLTAEQAARITVTGPDWEGEQTLQLAYLPVFADHVAEETELTFSLRGKENQIPVAQDQTLETYKNLPNTGKLKSTDPEGEALTFTLVRQPRRGTVEFSEDGSFTYTPKKNKVGVDSFTYTAADPAGKVSREATVTVTILKPSDAAQYTDTLGRECRFAAEWMRHTGIFTGEQLAQEPCFGPEKTVTQGEFLAMLLKTLEIPTEEELTCSGCEDAPVWLRPYLAAAVRSGLAEAMDAFSPDGPITGTQAAALLENALDTDAFADLTDQPLTRSDSALLLYQAAKLHAADKCDTLL